MFERLINFLFRRQRDAPEARPKFETLNEPLFSKPEIPDGDGEIHPEFDEWSEGLPPDWRARRKAVLKRDNSICQAPGCIRSGLYFNAHHMRERWRGGSHRLENLATVCPVHHAIAHLDTNKIEVEEDQCTIVSRYWRRKPFSAERIEVRMSIRRFELVSAEQLSEIRKRFGLRCQICGKENWSGNLRSNDLVWTWCPGCNGRWDFDPGVCEETGTHLATSFVVSQNRGRFDLDAKLIKGIDAPRWFEGCPECLNNERRGYLKEKRSIFGRFVGCSEWPTCGYKRNLRR